MDASAKKQPAQNSQPESSTQEQPETTLSAHVSKFVELTTALDDAVRSKNQDAIDVAQNKLQTFYVTLSPGEQYDIKEYLQKSIVGKVIDDDRGKVWNGVARVMHWPARIIDTSAKPLAEFLGETVELVLLVLGNSVGGFIRGVRGAARTIYRSST